MLPISRFEENERAARWLLALVLAVAFAVRLWMVLKLPRYFDDHYVLNNLTRVLGGSLRPRHTFYGSLSYLPQALGLAVCDFLHSLTGIDALAVKGPQIEGFTLGAYRITRMFVMAYGLLSLVMAYLVGRRLFSPMVGAVAAAVLASYPRHLKSSIQLKPDMLAMLFTLVTLYWTEGVTRNPRLSRFLLAGVGVGLATSAKYTGAASALPLAAWALWTGFRDRRRWGWLVLAGVTAVGTYFVLNPFIGTVLHYAPKLVKGYAAHARRDQSGHLTVLLGEIEFLASDHGWILGAFLLLGTALLIHHLWRQPQSREGIAAVLLLSLFLGYPLLHAAGMTLFRRQNLMPAMAAASLVCAYGIVWCGRRIADRAGSRAPVMAAVIGLPLCWVLLTRPVNQAYRLLVPDTWAFTAKTLGNRLATVRGRHVAYEPASAALRLSERGQRIATTAVPSLAALSPAVLDLTDAEVFPLARTEGPEAGFYRERQSRLASDCRLEIHSQLFSRRGKPLLVLFHPWAPDGNAVPLGIERSGGAPGELVALLPPGLSSGDVVSLELLRPNSERSLTTVQVQPGGDRLPLQFAGRRRRRARFLTPRFQYQGGAAEIRIPTSANADPAAFQLFLWSWTPAPCPEKIPAS
ncbi:MAG TPA: glycosyltransferase family 39 protein [Thermoanaerobaculia bacterium]|nr:glycosyltransferase family 39 protein [Thermoanaerobaculia bacterium]